jgi:amino acid adenylation domain-containing protein
MNKIENETNSTLDVAIAATQNIKERDYWLGKLAGELVKCSIPSAPRRMRPPAESSVTARMRSTEFVLPTELSNRLVRMSNASDARLFMILYAGMAVLTAKYTGNSDIILGTTINRQPREVALINKVLALRCDVHPHHTFKDLLMTARRIIAEAAENQDYPLSTLLYKLGLPETDDVNPLFDIAVLLENIHEKEYLQGTRTNIIITFHRTGETINGRVEYSVYNYDKPFIQALMDHFNRILETALINVDIRVAEIQMVSPEEKRRILEEFNNIDNNIDNNMDNNMDNTDKRISRRKTLQRLFEEQAERTPDRTALAARETPHHSMKYITYARLNERSEQRTGYLKRKGVGPGTITAVIADDSIETVTWILAILKAGSAYLPIEPDTPKERIRFMQNDSNAALVLTSSHRLEDEEKSAPEKTDSGTPSDPAYIIYTSGTTGKPKGVMVEHGGVINLIDWFAKRHRIEPGTRVFQLSGFTFDAGVEDIFGTLLHGGMLYTLDNDISEDIDAFCRFVEKHRIQLVNFVPSMLNMLLGHEYRLKSLEEVITGGERLEETVKKRIMANGYRLYNNYGPTEITVDALSSRCTEEPVTLGTPIDNVTVYILDQYRQPTPVGIPGELVVGGIGVARGYMNRPELTAERFIPQPPSISNQHNEAQQQNRCYRTGDLARWNHDGNVEFLGRMDHQVKIRGFRIEPGEVENHLTRIETVKESVVIAREEENGELYLCAYYVTENTVDNTVENRSEGAHSRIRTELMGKLPEYMVPSYFIQLDQMPLTPNGKIDRKALPSPFDKEGKYYVPPGNDIETKLVEIWADVLGIEPEHIGINDDFFESGGHSLKATVLIYRIRKEFNVEFPLSRIFSDPTIRQFAQLISKAEKSIFEDIHPVEKRDYYLQSPAQKRMFIQNRMKGENDISDNASEMIMVEGRLHIQRLERTLVGLIQRHEALRTSFRMLGKNPIQRVHDRVEFDIRHIEASEEQLDDVIARFIRPFNLGNAPLLRIGLLKLESEKHLLLFDMHHIITDGVSMGIFSADFVAMYYEEPLPELKLQYKDFTQWQDRYLRSDAIKRQEEYWLERYSGKIPALDFPTDYPRPQIQDFEGDYLEFAFTPELTEAVNELVTDYDVTVYMVMLAVYNILLARYTGQEDIIVGTPIAARQHPDLENIMGLFVNTLAMRNKPEKNKTYREFLEEVKTHALEAYENQDYQFEELVNRLEVERHPGRNVMFDTMFVVQNADMNQNNDDPYDIMKDLKFIPYTYKERITQFDIITHVFERKDRITFKIRYAVKLYKQETIAKLTQHLINITEEVTREPGVLIGKIKMLSGREREELFTKSNREILEKTDVEFDF